MARDVAIVVNAVLTKAKEPTVGAATLLPEIAWVVPAASTVTFILANAAPAQVDVVVMVVKAVVNAAISTLMLAVSSEDRVPVAFCV
mgnify:CR=1 FL=1